MANSPKTSDGYNQSQGQLGEGWGCIQWKSPLFKLGGVGLITNNAKAKKRHSLCAKSWQQQFWPDRSAVATSILFLGLTRGEKRQCSDKCYEPIEAVTWGERGFKPWWLRGQSQGHILKASFTCSKPGLVIENHVLLKWLNTFDLGVLSLSVCLFSLFHPSLVDFYSLEIDHRKFYDLWKKSNLWKNLKETSGKTPVCIS